MQVIEVLLYKGEKLSQMVTSMKSSMEGSRDLATDSFVLLSHLDALLRKAREAKILNRLKPAFRSDLRVTKQDQDQKERDNISSSLISDDVDGLIKKHAVRGS